MNFTANFMRPIASSVSIDDDMITVNLKDGRIVSAPLAWYPRLLNADSGDRLKFKLVGGGVGIHWSVLNEDLSIDGILAGIPALNSGNKIVA